LSRPSGAENEWIPAQVPAFRLLVNRSATWAEFNEELHCARTFVREPRLLTTIKVSNSPPERTFDDQA